MKISELDYSYPEELVAKDPRHPPRVMQVDGGRPTEISWASLLEMFKPGDLLVLNETKVIPRRLFALGDRGGEFEVLFINPSDSGADQDIQGGAVWDVMFPSSRLKKAEGLTFPEGLTATMIQGGRVQKLLLNRPASDDYFQKHGDMPLPPYIQKARGVRRNSPGDRENYQSHWAKVSGSSAAPTASLHFKKEDIAEIEKRGTLVRKLILHVGLGTFLPVTTEDLDDFKMHEEWVSVPVETWRQVEATKAEGRRVWALGSTVVRALEASAAGLLPLSQESNAYSGPTGILIQPGHDFRAVDRMLTNFHQPQSTLLSLVAAFGGLEAVKSAYAWAIANKFRLFSYGDLTLWIRD